MARYVVIYAISSFAIVILTNSVFSFFVIQLFMRFGTKLYRQVVAISMGTKCAPLVVDLFLFCCSHSSFAIILKGMGEMVALLFVFLVSCECCMALPHGATWLVCSL